MNTKCQEIIVVDGEIGAGKTTLIEALREKLTSLGKNVCVITEPVEQWQKVKILGLFYSDPKRYAYDFQTFTFVTRIEEARNKYEQNKNADVYLLERSILTDRYIFMELQKKQVSDTHINMYNTWFDLWKVLMPFDLSKAKYLYLKPKLNNCMERITVRGREEEKTITLVKKRHRRRGKKRSEQNDTGKGGVGIEYQERLRRAHEAFFEGKHKDEFPSQESRPFPLSSVITITGETADGDFTPKGMQKSNTVNDILTKLKIT